MSSIAAALNDNVLNRFGMYYMLVFRFPDNINNIPKRSKARKYKRAPIRHLSLEECSYSGRRGSISAVLNYAYVYGPSGARVMTCIPSHYFTQIIIVQGRNYRGPGPVHTGVSVFRFLFSLHALIAFYEIVVNTNRRSTSRLVVQITSVRSLLLRTNDNNGNTARNK